MVLKHTCNWERGQKPELEHDVSHSKSDWLRLVLHNFPSSVWSNKTQDERNGRSRSHGYVPYIVGRCTFIVTVSLSLPLLLPEQQCPDLLSEVNDQIYARSTVLADGRLRSASELSYLPKRTNRADKLEPYRKDRGSMGERARVYHAPRLAQPSFGSPPTSQPPCYDESVAESA